jgi:hypothetical protein
MSTTAGRSSCDTKGSHPSWRKARRTCDEVFQGPRSARWRGPGAGRRSAPDAGPGARRASPRPADPKPKRAFPVRRGDFRSNTKAPSPSSRRVTSGQIRKCPFPVQCGDFGSSSVRDEGRPGHAQPRWRHWRREPLRTPASRGGPAEEASSGNGSVRLCLRAPMQKPREAFRPTASRPLPSTGVVGSPCRGGLWHRCVWGEAARLHVRAPTTATDALWEQTGVGLSVERWRNSAR